MKTKKRKQKQYQAAAKVAIIREHLIENKSVSDICDEYDIYPSLYYRWQKQLFEEGEKAFTAKSDTTVNQLRQEVRELEAKLVRKDEVLGEVMEEYVTLKKRIGDR